MKRQFEFTEATAGLLRRVKRIMKSVTPTKTRASEYEVAVQRIRETKRKFNEERQGLYEQLKSGTPSPAYLNKKINPYRSPTGLKRDFCTPQNFGRHADSALKYSRRSPIEKPRINDIAVSPQLSTINWVIESCRGLCAKHNEAPIPPPYKPTRNFLRRIAKRQRKIDNYWEYYIMSRNDSVYNKETIQTIISENKTITNYVLRNRKKHSLWKQRGRVLPRQTELDICKYLSDSFI